MGSKCHGMSSSASAASGSAGMRDWKLTANRQRQLGRPIPEPMGKLMYA